MSIIPTIGQMRMVLKLERPVKSSDDTGGQHEVYEEWFTTRGFLDMERSYRTFETGYDESVKTYKCWLPWRNELEQGLTKDVRVIFEARSFQIDSFTMIREQRRLFQLKLTEVR
jgi:SPP1 family predicted phage head-tail adaptor